MSAEGGTPPERSRPVLRSQTKGSGGKKIESPEDNPLGKRKRTAANQSPSVEVNTRKSPKRTKKAKNETEETKEEEEEEEIVTTATATETQTVETPTKQTPDLSLPPISSPSGLPPLNTDAELLDYLRASLTGILQKIPKSQTNAAANIWANLLSPPPSVNVLPPKSKTKENSSLVSSRGKRKSITPKKSPLSKSKVSDEVEEPESEAVIQQKQNIKRQIKADLGKLIINPADIDLSFEEFPYYLNDAIKQQLISSAFMYLVKPEYTKYITDLPIGRKILLQGPPGTEIYQEKLVKALARQFKASLLILDSSVLEGDKIPREEVATVDEEGSGEGEEETDNWGDSMEGVSSTSRTPKFKIGDKVRYIGPSPTSVPLRLLRGGLYAPTSSRGEHQGPYGGSKGKVVLTLDENPRKIGVRFDKSIPGGINLGNLCDDGHGYFVDVSELRLDSDKTERNDSLTIEAIFEHLQEDPKPTIMFIREAEKVILGNFERYSLFKKLLNQATVPLLVVGSVVSGEFRNKPSSVSMVFSSKGHNHSLLDVALLDQISRMEDRGRDNSKYIKLLNKLLPNKINIQPPVDTDELNEWTRMIAKDVELLRFEKNKLNLKKVMEKNGLEVPDLNSELLSKQTQVITMENIEKIVGLAVSYHLMKNEEPLTNSGKLSMSLESVEYAIKVVKSMEPEAKAKALKDVEPENEFERRLLADVIPANEIGVSFEDIGALDEVKDTLRELVMLPLQRPELFSRGNLTKPCKGILLFGPPGTGKTMLAKAVACQSGANFINVSMSSIASKWFGEGEKYVKAIFTLASKIAPVVIFIDEVDSILGKREKNGEHEAMRKMKNEFMANWDGLKTKENERVLVLAASNRPFDLDDAVLRRMARRMLIDLPTVEQRVKILKVILAKEELDGDFNFDSLALMTEGYSGSDLKNLCIAAAYNPIREFLQQEKKEMEGKGENEGKKSPPVELRPLSLKDFEKAKEQISPSISEDAASIAELRKWNELYGEGGSRKKDILPYFM